MLGLNTYRHYLDKHDFQWDIGVTQYHLVSIVKIGQTRPPLSTCPVTLSQISGTHLHTICIWGSCVYFDMGRHQTEHIRSNSAKTYRNSGN